MPEVRYICWWDWHYTSTLQRMQPSPVGRVYFNLGAGCVGAVEHRTLLVGAVEHRTLPVGRPCAFGNRTYARVESLDTAGYSGWKAHLQAGAAPPS